MLPVRLFCGVLLAFGWCAADAFAQEEGEEPEPEAAPADSATPTATPALEEEPPQGDIVKLKNGTLITGYQVIRVTHTHYLLEGLYDPTTDQTVTIRVPRATVAEVTYDDIDPLEQRKAMAEVPGADQRTTVEGKRLSDALYASLNTDISEPPLVLENKTLVEVLNQINERTANLLKVAPEIVEAPTPRPWRGTVEPGTTLSVFLDTNITAAYPGLMVEYEENAILVKVRPIPAEEQGANEPPSDAPSAPENTPPAAVPPLLLRPPSAPQGEA